MTREEFEALIGKTVATAVAERMAAAEEAHQRQSHEATELIARLRESGAGGTTAVGAEKGLGAARLIRALAANRGNLRDASDFVLKHFQDEALAKALAAGDGTAGGFLVPPDYSRDVIELLRPMSVVRAANPVTVPMPNGAVTVPKVTGGSTSYYVGENQNITPSEPTVGEIRLTYKKLAALVPISNDLLRFASPSADAFVRDDLVRSMAAREDIAFLRGDGTQYTPRGLRSWTPAANVIAANGTVNLANVTIDLSKLINTLEAANVKLMRPAWFFTPRTKNYLMSVRDGNGNFAWQQEMLRGTLWGIPYFVTTQIPNNLGGSSNASEVYLVEMTDVLLGESERLTIDSSSEAAYYDGANVQAAFSRDQTVIRAITEHDLGVRHDESVAYLSGITWGV